MQADSIFPARSRFAVVVFSGILLAAATGCHRPPSADVVATVNSKEIMRADLDKYYQSTLGDTPQQQQLSSNESYIRRLQVLRQMILDEILEQRAAKLNLAASDEDVNVKLTELKAPYTQDEFNNQLKSRNLTLDDYKKDLRRELTKEKLLNKEIESKINITDAQIASYYSANKAEFNYIEPRYHLAQIVVTTTPTPSQQAGNLQNNKASSEADAKKKIQALHTHVDNGDDFAAVAMNYSEDPNTASNGGDMGFVAESALKSDTSVYEAIQKLKPNQITDILPIFDNSPAHKIAGYAIYKLFSREPAGQRELNNPRVQQYIHQTLHDSEIQLLQNAYYETLQDEAKVRNYYAEQILKQGAQ